MLASLNFAAKFSNYFNFKCFKTFIACSKKVKQEVVGYILIQSNIIVDVLFNV